MVNIGRAFRTTLVQIQRSGWLAWASISVMTLAFLISTVFGMLAYSFNLFLQSVEQEPQIYAFFEIGTSETKIKQIQTEWEKLPGVVYVEYTSEDQAKQEFYEAQSELNELAAKAVEERNLPASLAIRLESLNYADQVNETVQDSKSENSDLKVILYSEEIVDNIREIFFWIRVGGGTIIAILFIVLILFTLLIVEFKMHNRSEEIEIMQLVGGSLLYIRLPFIIEGAIYGMLGGLISNIILIIFAGIVTYQLTNNELNYLKELVNSLNWPTFTTTELVLLFFLVILSGAILGGLNSFVAIRRYIK